MSTQHDLTLLLRSRMPIILIETGDEARVLELLRIAAVSRARDDYLPLFRWTVTDGLQRLDIDLEPQLHNAEPDEVLRHIRAVTKPGIYVLLDFHPFLDNPVTVRLIKDICIRYGEVPRQLVLISHSLRLPSELDSFAARFDMALPTLAERDAIVRRVVGQYSAENPGSRVQLDPRAYDLLLDNLAGLTHSETERLARNAVFLDGAVTRSDLPEVMQAKYALLNRGGILHFEYDTARFREVGGLRKLKAWLARRKDAFLAKPDAAHLDPPRGILLIGVQGCGKSLTAKAIAGVFGLPLLRLDFGALYNKYHGETERNLRESLNTANVMAPCVLWIDEIEKGLAGRGGETGTTRRVLATFLTWLAEKKQRVFVVATANDIEELPPELVRKGRFDEIFFVDLPTGPVRRSIFEIHLERRSKPAAQFDLDALASASEGFSGAEIEQAVVSALFTAHARGERIDSQHILQELAGTRPLSVVMRERIAALRQWAADRTVPAD